MPFFHFDLLGDLGLVFSLFCICFSLHETVFFQWYKLLNVYSFSKAYYTVILHIHEDTFGII